MPNQLDELTASIRELEATLASAPSEMRPIVEQQLQALRSTASLLAQAQPQIEANAQHRALIAPELAAFFRSEPPAPVPTWLPDDVARASVTEGWMHPGPGVKVYFEDDSVGCAISQGPGQRPIRHGLNLEFYAATGRLESQRFYENGLLRWSVDYHATGGRALVGFYAATEPLSYPEHGLITRFAPNGTVVSQQYFEHGVPHGWSKQWEDDGHPIGATRFERGHAVETVLPDGSRRAV